MAEQKYTLREARLELNKKECAERGHDYEIFYDMGSNHPQTILCQRCGKSWKVEERA